MRSHALVAPETDTTQSRRIVAWLSALALGTGLALTQAIPLEAQERPATFAELAEQISAKRVQSIHVWSEAEGAKPDAVVTGFRFDKSINDFVIEKG